MSRLLLLLSLLLPAAAQAEPGEPPFDLVELRDAWPGEDRVVLESTRVVEMPSSDVLRTRHRSVIAVLDDAARDDLALFEFEHRPDCRELVGLTSQVVDPRGLTQELGLDDLLWAPLGDHPTDAERSGQIARGPRRGLAAGSLITEEVTVERRASCFGGILSARGALASPVPHESLEVTVSCASGDCATWLSDPALRGAASDDGELHVEVGRLVSPPPEPHAASLRPARVFVSSEPDPLAPGRLLRQGLDEQAPRWRSVLPSYERAAKRAFPRIKDRATRIATWIGELPTLESGPFHELGLDWGEPVEADQRLLLPLERWALAWALLESEGAVPIVVGRDEAPPEVASLQAWVWVGLQLPGRGVLLDDDFRPTLSGSTPGLAGRWLLLLDGDEPRLDRFASSPGLRQIHREGTLSIAGNDSSKFAVVLRLAGYQASAWRESWDEWLQTWKEAPPLKRMDIEDWEARFVSAKLGRKTVRGRVKPGEEADQLTLVAHYGEPGTMTRDGGLTTMRVPLVLHPELSELSPARRRHADFELTLADDRWQLQIAAPPGHRLVGLPPDESFSDGPLEVSVDWEQQGTGARLDYRLKVGAKRIPASSSAAVWEVAAIVRRLSRTRLLFVRE